MKTLCLVITAVCAFSFATFSKESLAPPKREFVVELDPNSDVQLAAVGSVRTVESFGVADKTYAVYQADSASALTKYLQRAGLVPKKVTEVKDMNSPERGGGKPAGDRPRMGQKTYVIERTIPGAGRFPEAKKQAISRKSNAAIAEIGESIEWVHSYLTDEGTYCIYRATDEATIRRHGAIAGAPITKVSQAQAVSSP